ncbi:MAG: phosphotransferase family protein [Tissierellales bacterium]
MSFTPFLASVAQTLMTRVHPSVTDARSRDALEACVRAVAGMAAALEVADERHVLSLPLPDSATEGTTPLLVTTPPENLAANDQSAARIAAGAHWLKQGHWLENTDDRASALAMLDWELKTLDSKITSITHRLHAGGEDQDDLKSLEIDPLALERYFLQRYGAHSGARITNFRQATGGRSRQTAVFNLEGDTGLPHGLVVQRDHPASITSFGVESQYPVLELVSRSKLKTSKPVLLEMDRSVIGAPFLILEKASGDVAGADYFAPPQSPALALELAEQLATLHAIDPSPLTDTIRSTVENGTVKEWRDELDSIEAAWQQLNHAPSMAISAAFAWMRAHIDQVGAERAIVHNDAAFHNILIENGHFSSLLDWELVHIGHPAEDLGYCRAFVQEIIEWDEFVDAYVASGGQRFPAPVVDYFSLRAGIHLLTLLQYGCSKLISGATSDINLAEVGTYFIPRHHNRIATMVATVLSRA